MNEFLPLKRCRIYRSWMKNHMTVRYYGNLLCALAQGGLKDPKLLEFMSGAEHLMIEHGIRIVKSGEFVELEFLEENQPAINVIPNRERRRMDKVLMAQLASTHQAEECYDI